ncbi:MAG: Alpha/Beta hydrolase protein [Benjaminiella poitrasii]|nr:MAG: Alpha/Beta hydrolase protein [Benjaminiella poitrasii]
MTVDKRHFHRNYQLCGLENDIHSPLIWLIHGAGGDLHHYDAIAKVLVNNGFRVLLMDVRFHGLSQPLVESENEPPLNQLLFSFADVIHDMDIILEEVKQQHYARYKNKIHLFLGGLSMGGMISLLYAADKDLKTNQNFVMEGLILLAAGIPYMELPRFGWDIYAERKATMDDLRNTRAAITLSSSTPNGRVEVERSLKLISDHALYECMVAIATLLPSPPVGQPTPPYKLLTQAPTLLIVPDQDAYTRPELELLHKTNLEQGVQSELVIIENAGHMVILDQPEQVADQITNFCKRLS